MTVINLENDDSHQIILKSTFTLTYNKLPY